LGSIASGSIASGGIASDGIPEGPDEFLGVGRLRNGVARTPTHYAVENLLAPSAGKPGHIPGIDLDHFPSSDEF
jgi:hypothetical protein